MGNKNYYIFLPSIERPITVVPQRQKKYIAHCSLRYRNNFAIIKINFH